MVSEWVAKVTRGEGLVDENEGAVTLVAPADEMLASEFIRHVHLRHNHLPFRSRDNHDADHQTAGDLLDHEHAVRE